MDAYEVARHTGEMIRDRAEALGANNDGTFPLLHLLLNSDWQVGESRVSHEVFNNLIRVLLKGSTKHKTLNQEVLQAWGRPIDLRMKLLSILYRLPGGAYEEVLKEVFIGAFNRIPASAEWAEAATWLRQNNRVEYGVQENVAIYDPNGGVLAIKSLPYFRIQR